jgi:hypothetical protein
MNDEMRLPGFVSDDADDPRVLAVAGARATLLASESDLDAESLEFEWTDSDRGDALMVHFRRLGDERWHHRTF